jgi:hypothetical protein
VLPTGFLVNDVLCLVEDLLVLLWMLTREFRALLARSLKLSPIPMMPPAVSIDHRYQYWLPGCMASLFASRWDYHS